MKVVNSLYIFKTKHKLINTTGYFFKQFGWDKKCSLSVQKNVCWNMGKFVARFFNVHRNFVNLGI